MKDDTEDWKAPTSCGLWTGGEDVLTVYKSWRPRNSRAGCTNCLHSMCLPDACLLDQSGAFQRTCSLQADSSILGTHKSIFAIETIRTIKAQRFWEMRLFSDCENLASVFHGKFSSLMQRHSKRFEDIQVLTWKHKDMFRFILYFADWSHSSALVLNW